MAGWSVPLSDLRVSAEDIAAVVAVYESGWLSMGPETEELEREFADYVGCREAVAVTTGTAALHLACLAAGLGPGDEVILPSLTFVASAAAVEYTGATPVFADVADVRRPWLSAEACAAAITDRTAAILAVHYGGHSGEIDALKGLAGERDLLLLEDSAHAAGSRLNGRHLGTFGNAAAFSFYANKNLAVGEGGIVTTDDHHWAETMRRLRSHGMTSDTWPRHHDRAGTYEVEQLGFNYRIDEPRAALARSRLTRLEEDNSRRRALDQRYRELLAEVSAVTPIETTGDGLRSSHHLFVAVLDDPSYRDEFRRMLSARGIQTSLHYPPLHRTPRYRASARALPVTEAFGSSAVTLPMFAEMTHAQQDLVVAAVREATGALARA